ncbi:hypothetical protein GCM10007862_02330 [Dyella lipolytica]|uniref:Uncharacterized protein n=1 Tax=Dyella lipolytica TaxID=1867835 RepID=A0ABW8IQ71_9GAMM|nr:hypothetical protein [Dyella lipolytica]GLQ45182.1 hypothetical protein GCM10007862_02330 [Dyella lipolytica]
MSSIFTTTLLLASLMHFHDMQHALLPTPCFEEINAVEGNLTPDDLWAAYTHQSDQDPDWLLIRASRGVVLGTLLAVPMLTSAKLIAERVRGWGWFARMVQR